MTLIERLDPFSAQKYLSTLELSKQDRAAMDYCSLMSVSMWAGLINGELAAMWGLMPPTVLSNQAYLWLYTTEAMEGHEFILVRHSQMVVKEMLKEYPSICGHAVVSNHKAVRWLKWLGAKFEHPIGGGLPFRITNNG
jgi:hypothetical protein